MYLPYTLCNRVHAYTAGSTSELWFAALDKVIAAKTDCKPTNDQQQQQQQRLAVAVMGSVIDALLQRVLDAMTGVRHATATTFHQYQYASERKQHVGTQHACSYRAVYEALLMLF
jgi:hypothetical protein